MNKERRPSPICPSCGSDSTYRDRPDGTSGESDYYGCRNGHEWDVYCSWFAPSLSELIPAINRICGKQLKWGKCLMGRDHDGECGRVGLR